MICTQANATVVDGVRQRWEDFAAATIDIFPRPDAASLAVQFALDERKRLIDGILAEYPMLRAVAEECISLWEEGLPLDSSTVRRAREALGDA